MKHRCTKTHRDPEALEARRKRAGRLFAKGLSRAEAARRLKVSQMSTSRWYRTWQTQGEDGLRSKGQPGLPPRLSGEQRQQLEEALLAGPLAAGYATDLWNLARIRALIETRFGVRYHISHTWLLLQRMGWSWQKPATQAKERDEAAIAHWINEEWPRQKRGRAAEAPHCSSGTKRASRSGLR